MTPRKNRPTEALVAATLALGLLHPNAFGLMWIVLLVVCLWRIATSFGPAQTINHNALWKIWLLAFGPLLLVYLLSIPVHGSTIGHIEALEPVLGGLLLAAGLSAKETDFQWLVRGALLGSVFGLVVAIVEMGIFGQPRVGLQYHPINFGMVCGGALLILVVRLKADFHALTAAGAAACGLALMASGSRGPILAFFICAIALMLFLRREHRLPRTRRHILTGLFFGLTVIAVAALIQRFLTDAELGADSSVGIRWELIKISILQMLKTPWFGIGADQAGKFFAQFPGPVGEVGHAHITALNLGLELGVAGMLSWIWGVGVSGWFFWTMRTQTQGTMWATGLLMTVYLFLCSMAQDLMSHTFNRRFFVFITVVLMVAAFAEKHSLNKNTGLKVRAQTTP